MTLKECPSAAMALSDLAAAKDKLLKAFKDMQKNGDPTKTSDEQYGEALREAESFALSV